MTLQELERIFPRLVEARDPASGRYIGRELISSPGVGKSSLIKQMVQKLSASTGVEWGLSTTFIATANPMTMMGYDMPQKRQDGKLVSCFIDPFWKTCDREWGHRPMDSFTRGIWFLDEWDKGEADVKKLSAEGFLNGRIGPHYLPEGWIVIAASNRAKDKSGSTKTYDFIINRRAELHIEPDAASLSRWMDKHAIHPTIKTFVSQNPQIVFTDKVPDLQGPWPTPRSVMLAAGELEALSGEPGGLASDAAANECCTGIIGTAATAQLFATIRLAKEMPEFSAIIKSPSQCRIPQGLDAMMLVCYHLASLVEEEHVGPAITYIDRFPPEFSIVFVKAAVGRNQDLVLTKAFGDWSIKNAAILAAVAELK